MFLVLLSQTHYFSPLGFLSCGPPFIRLSCGLQKNPTAQNTGKKMLCWTTLQCVALASERERWWLRKEQGTEGRKHPLSLDIFDSKDNDLGRVLLIHCHRKWWMLHASHSYESMSCGTEKLQVNQSCHRVALSICSLEASLFHRRSTFCNLFQMAFSSHRMIWGDSL